MLARISRHVVEYLHSKMFVPDLQLDPLNVVLQIDREQEAQLLIHHVVLALSLLPKEALKLALGDSYLVKRSDEDDISQIVG